MFNFFFKETRIFGEEGRERCCRVRKEEERRTKKGENRERRKAAAGLQGAAKKIRKVRRLLGLGYVYG